MSQPIAVVTVTHTMQDGSVTARVRELDSAKGWDDLVYEARDFARATDGVIAATVCLIKPGSLPVLTKSFQADEYSA
jgi:hypothetical protein